MIRLSMHFILSLTPRDESVEVVVRGLYRPDPIRSTKVVAQGGEICWCREVWRQRGGETAKHGSRVELGRVMIAESKKTRYVEGGTYKLRSRKRLVISLP